MLRKNDDFEPRAVLSDIVLGCYCILKIHILLSMAELVSGLYFFAYLRLLSIFVYIFLRQISNIFNETAVNELMNCFKSAHHLVEICSIFGFCRFAST